MKMTGLFRVFDRVLTRILSPPAQIELKTSDTYRGTLLESEDNWNCQLKTITHTAKVRLPDWPVWRGKFNVRDSAVSKLIPAGGSDIGGEWGLGEAGKW